MENLREWLGYILEEYGLPPLLVLAGLLGAIVSAYYHDNTAVTQSFLLLSVVGTGIWYLESIGTRPQSTVSRWLRRKLDEQGRWILRRYELRRSNPRQDEFSRVVCSLLADAEFAGALCGKKNLGVDDPLRYYKKFFDRAAEMHESDRLDRGEIVRVIRAFVEPYETEHVQAHRFIDGDDERPRPAVRALTIRKQSMRKLVEPEFRGTERLLRKGLGFVIFVRAGGVEVLVHEIKFGRFVFWPIRDRIMIEQVAGLYRRICEASDERDDEKQSIERLMDAIGSGLETMPTVQPRRGAEGDRHR